MSTAETDGRKLFSIVLATYNCGRKVESSIESILEQRRDLFELIVVDGASSDETLDCIKKYENDLTLISEPDAGVYHAFNKGIKRATGRYLYFIGAGDRLREGALEEVEESLAAAMDDDDADADAPVLVYGDAYVVQAQMPYGDQYDESRIKTQNICHQAVFYHRAVFELVGNYDLRYNICADWVLNLKCFGEPRIEKRYLPRVIADFEGGGLSSMTEDDHFKKDFPRLIRKHLGVKSYIAYKSSFTSADVYRKIYFPFFRPLVGAVRRLKKGGRNLKKGEAKP